MTVGKRLKRFDRGVLWAATELVDTYGLFNVAADLIREQSLQGYDCRLLCDWQKNVLSRINESFDLKLNLGKHPINMTDDEFDDLLGRLLIERFGRDHAFFPKSTDPAFESSRTVLGADLRRLRAKIIRSGRTMLTWDDIEKAAKDVRREREGTPND